MMFLLSLVLGGFGGYATYVGWLGIGVGSIGAAITVGLLIFLLALVAGIFIIAIEF